jgi:hypothetical protein
MRRILRLALLATLIVVLFPASVYATFPANIDFEDEASYGTYTPAALNNPNIGAVDINLNWIDVEPQQGVFNWAPADKVAADWAAQGKQYNLIVRYIAEGSSGTNCSGHQYMPAWEIDRIPHFCDSDTGVIVPDYFDAGFKADLKAYAQAIANHFATSPYRNNILYVRMGVGWGGEGFPLMLTGDYATDQQQLNAWGYTPQNWENWQEELMAYYQDVFSYTTMIYPRNSQDQDPTTGQPLENVVSNWVAARGMGVGQQGLVPGAVYPHLQSLRSQYTAMYMQFQTVAPVGDATQLQGDIIAANQDGAQYIEWHTQDAINPAYQSLLAQWQQSVTNRFGWHAIKSAGLTIVNSARTTMRTAPHLAVSPPHTDHRHTSTRTAASTATHTPTVGRTTRHYEYVFPDGSMSVYDIDHRHKLVKQVSLPTTAGVRGVAASPVTHMLYISYGGDGGSHGNGSLLKYNLLTDQVVWTKNYHHGIDSMAISPDGKTIYMPDGELSPNGTWYVVAAATGTDIGTINAGTGPHNTVVSLNGSLVYLGGRNYNYFEVASTQTKQVVQKVGPFQSGIRPFTVNGKNTLVYASVTHFLGFQVGDLTTGKVLYTVPIKGFGVPANFPASDPSHGISLSRDERELYVLDAPNSYVHVFDVSGLPARPPVQVANIRMSHPMPGNETPCAYDCFKDGWLQHSADGRFVYVGDEGDVIETATRQVVATLPALANTRKMLEIDWRNGVPVFTTTRTGLGYVTNQVSPRNSPYAASP